MALKKEGLQNELTDRDKRKPYFDISCEFTSERKEVISIRGGRYEAQNGYGRLHSIEKNKYALENLLFEKFGLPYSSLDKFLDPDNSNVTIPIELLWTQENSILCEKRLPPIATMFHNQSPPDSSSNHMTLPSLGKRKRKN